MLIKPKEKNKNKQTRRKIENEPRFQDGASVLTAC